MMTEDQHDLVDFINQEIDKWDDERRYVRVLEIALAALTQPASPALKLPDGWKLVPVEPTEDMLVNGFESKPDERFSEPKVWAEYDAMSGCQQAAHRALLCWQAMLLAAPCAPYTAPIEPICATGGWQDPLLHPAIIALKNGEIHAPEVLDIFDAMACEIQVHRDYKRWDYAPKCSADGAVWVKVSERMPKRGQRVNAFYLNRLGKGRTIRAEYIYSKTEEAGECAPDTQCVEYCEESDTYFVTEGWYEVMDNWEEYGSIAVTEGNITHWMPLPTPPIP